MKNFFIYICEIFLIINFKNNDISDINSLRQKMDDKQKFLALSYIVHFFVF
jgi:hypothetical protein